ncbi:zinc ribbon domain-containing protein [Sulfurimonas sp. HSL3-2]|uniref:zinc ribbon domain-containing protein n=1 Tax=Hydrocurvibacter mobilis TaxID=3131936 RepID=UPI0031F9B81F
MNKHLKQLIDLSEVDKEIDAFEPQIDEVNYKYEAALATKDNLDNEISSLEEEMKNEELKKHKNELHLAELSAKLEENKKKAAEIKTEREMKSLQLEEEIAKEQVTFANEEIVRLDKLITAKKEKLEELTQTRNELDANLSAIKADVDEKLASIEKARHEVFARKEKLVGGMNQKGLAFYQKIRRWAKNTTAVAVKEQACMGCFMHVNDKVYADVIKGEEIVTCPHCGRILYMAEGEEA